MKKRLFILSLLLLIITGVNAQDLKEIKLNAPNKNRGTTVMKALADRHSEREFAAKALSLDDLSDLLWAANGINRTNGKRTAPSALNKQEVDIYVILQEGAYIYNAQSNKLIPLNKGDHRSAVASGQDFVNDAPVCLILVADLSKFGDLSEQSKLMGAVDAGIVCQNINLFCSAAGLSTVPRATMDKAALKSILKLSDSQMPIMNNPVGYPKK